jgi:mRNA interferase MazF
MAGVRRGDVRLHRFPPPDKLRPVVVLTRDSAIQYLDSVTVAPITSSVRGIASQVLLDEDDGMKMPCAVNLHYVLTVKKHALGQRVAGLSAVRMAEICDAFNFATGCGSGD